MNLAELVATRMKAIETMGQRMAIKPTAELAERLSKETLNAHAGRIEQRIARLDRQRAAMLARIDTALDAEQAALVVIRKMAERMPAANPGKEAQPAATAPTPRAASAAKAKPKAKTGAKAKTAARKKPARAKPAKPA